MDTTVDSGYASSSSYFAPHPEWQLSRTYENWKIADAATQRLFVDLRAKERCEEMLRAARKRRDQAQRRCVSISLSTWREVGGWVRPAGCRLAVHPYDLGPPHWQSEDETQAVPPQHPVWQTKDR